MTPILDRIRAHGGEAIRDKWTIRLRRGRLSDAAVSWLKANREALIREAWPEYDDWQERAAIIEFEAGLARPAAEEAAYSLIMNKDYADAG